ncbi:MAG TPA: hypothetical protein VD997_13580 [Phycisphaerales bacterium]|nr:hypothetical protein [Phycisphaerales bacterium]
MSDKARRSNAWDERHLRGPWLWPVKAVVKALSSITLAVILLVFVVLYGISASVPVGLLALAPTWLVYALVFVLIVGGMGALGAWGVARALGGAGRGTRFVAAFAAMLVLAGVGVWVWVTNVWPRLRYDEVTHTGLRFFAGFVEANRAITLRRLPGVEMTELEYYAAWPLRWALLLFVLNMVVATVRRIEFTFKNIGVLTVHTGIVIMALGSVYYAGLKQEGDTLLLAGQPDPHTGRPSPGPIQDVFYDNTRVALFVNPKRMGWEQRLVNGLPRYNDYNLGAGRGELASGVARWKKDAVPESLPALAIEPEATPTTMVDSDVSLKIVGYASYAEEESDYARVEVPQGSTEMKTSRWHDGSKSHEPLRFVFLHSQLEDEQGRVSDEPVVSFVMPPLSAKDRESGNDVFSLEYTFGESGGMPESRWRDLSEPLPAGTQHALVIEVPGKDGAPSHREVVPVANGSAFDVGKTGYRVAVKELLPTPPFPIITEGYKGADSSVAVVTVTTPTGESFERYVYHRFPAINQDMLSERRANGQPVRRDADPAIRMGLIECDRIYVYIDESGGKTRAIVRQKGGLVKVTESLAPGQRLDMVEKVQLRIGEKWDAARRVELPKVVPPEKREKESVGTHDRAMVGVEVAASIGGRPWSQVQWLPFTRYMSLMQGGEREVVLPDGRVYGLAIGRLQRPLPGFGLRLLDFEMIAYDHRGAPRDYQSIVRVMPAGGSGFEVFDHVTKLNEPLQAPFHWDDGKSFFANLPGRLVAGMSPFQFKFSQSGWDQQGWQRTQKMADAGQLPRAFASFTILHVGNNPGIHLIALGGIMMGVGIPWAFYVKPWLVRREKRRIQEMVAAGTWRKPEAGKRKPEVETAGV